MKNSKIRLKEGSGNVFRDVGFSREEAAHLAIRADFCQGIPATSLTNRGFSAGQAVQSHVNVNAPGVQAAQRHWSRAH